MKPLLLLPLLLISTLASGQKYDSICDGFEWKLDYVVWGKHSNNQINYKTMENEIKLTPDFSKKYRVLTDQLAVREIMKGDVMKYDKASGSGLWVSPTYYPLLHWRELRILLEVHPDWFEIIEPLNDNPELLKQE